MLRWRLLLGTIFISVLAGLLALDHRLDTPGMILFPLALLLSLLVSHEYLGLLEARKLRPVKGVVYAGSLAIVAANAVPLFWQTQLEPLGWPLAAFALALLAAFLGEMRRYEGPGEVMERLALAVLGVAYSGLLLTFIVQMRLLGENGRWGVPAIASLLIVVKMGDIGAYTVGRLLGKHPMAPVLSPGKTWEGAAGGLAFACLGSWLALNCLLPLMLGDPWPKNSWGWLPYGVVVGAAGILGDLAESLIKRDLGRKDSSTWMPGFGGVLDLLDSVIFAGPVAFLFWKLGIVGP